MKIKLYTNVHEDAHEENLKFIELVVKGKLIEFTRLPENDDEVFEGVFEHTLRRFSYHNDDTFFTLFPNLKLNTKIEISHSTIHGYEETSGFVHDDDSSSGGVEGYCYLNTWQRLILNFWFKKLWIQRGSNFRWIVGILISVVGVLVALF